MTQTEQYLATLKFVASSPITLDHAAVACGYENFAAAIKEDRKVGGDTPLEDTSETQKVIRYHCFLAGAWAQELATDVASCDLIYFIFPD